MMKKILTFWGVIGAVLLAASCSNTRSYTDMLKDERKAIDKLMGDSDFVVLKSYPAEGKFGEHEFYKMSNDVYIQVVDTGNGNRAVVGKTRVLCRFIANRIMLDSTSAYSYIPNYGIESNGTQPLMFLYGSSASITQSGATTDLQTLVEELMSTGLQSGLQYVGEGGKVKLIVPFKVGSSTDMAQGWPVFYEMLSYTFYE